MYLKALEIQGFKSFPDKTIFNFDKAITAIVGPNGSGKSNISDAINWVMGEQSSKNLRGSRMEDVIFGGTANRKQLGYAEVSIILDNSEHLFNISENEVIVTRRYFRSGDGEYYINRHSCRLKDITDLLLDTGLGKEGYSLIGQGRIDEIISAKNSERHFVFEEAAGISRYRKRKEVAESNLANTENNLLRIKDKIAELEIQLAPLKEQSDKAREFLDYSQKLRVLEISAWTDEIDNINKSLRKLKNDVSVSYEKREILEDEQNKLYSLSESLSAEMQSLTVKIEGYRSELSRCGYTINENKSDIAVVKSQIVSGKNNCERIYSEIEKQKKRISYIEEQISSNCKRSDDVLKSKNKNIAELSALNLQYSEQTANIDAVSKQLSEAKNINLEYNSELANKNLLLSECCTSEQELSEREKLLNAQLENNKSKFENLSSQKSSKREQIEVLQAEIAKCQNREKGYELLLGNKHSDLQKASESFNALTLEVRDLSNRIKMLADMQKVYEGYNKAVKAVMLASESKKLQGVIKPVADIIEVARDYALAIETALGGAMQYIVVENETAGKNAIRYLKRRDSGRATFLPLNTIKPRLLYADNVENCSGFIGIASKLVSVDGKYKNIVENLLGNVAIAANLDVAVNMASEYGYKFKIVTLDGQVINQGGSMTGGSSNRTSGILSRAVELKELQQAYNISNNELENQRKLLDRAKSDAERSNDKREKCHSELLSLNNKLSVSQNELRHFEALLSSIEEDNLKWKQYIDEIILRRDELSSRKATLTEQIENLNSRISDLNLKLSDLESRHKDFDEECGELNGKILNTKAQISSCDSELTALKNTIDNFSSLKQDIEADISNHSQAVLNLESEIQTLLDRQTALEGELKQNNTKLVGLNAEIKKYQDELSEFDVKRVNADKDAKSKNTALLNVQRECLLFEQKISGLESEETVILDKLLETYSVTYDSAKDIRIKIENKSRNTQQILTLKDKISRLGSVNVGALEEYKRVKERYDFLDQQYKDVLSSQAGIRQIISEITVEMEKIFKSQFIEINKAFTEIFTEMFNGGKAYLTLDNPENVLDSGIEINVQPPGKALKSITLLSGGEKAFVSIALYFAFMKVHPTPFVVMDEIEAALDDNNIEIFANYVRKLSTKTQFIIITHRRGTMEASDVLYGITMQEKGISKMLRMNLDEAEQDAELFTN